MAGGIFPNHPFSLNIKCIIFTAILAGGYWYLPQKNKLILLFLLWAPYIALAWYDYAYNCQTNKLEPTIIPFGRYLWLPFKPPDYKAAYEAQSPGKKADYVKVDHLALWTIVIGLVWFIALKK